MVYSIQNLRDEVIEIPSHYMWGVLAFHLHSLRVYRRHILVWPILSLMWLVEHRNFHLSKCSGDYIFIIDPDEMPKEKLIKGIKSAVKDSGADLIMIPRINIHPGFTQKWLEKSTFTVNELDWINWPDYICRVFPNTPEIKYGNELHEVIVGYKKRICLQADPSIAIWHIKSIEKQSNRWNGEIFKVPEGDNLYDTLM